MDDPILTTRLVKPKKRSNAESENEGLACLGRSRNHTVGSSNPESERDSHLVQHLCTEK